MIVCSHPPDFGIECIQLGNDANKAKGKAKANPKPVMPALNCIAPPSDVKEPANKDPKIGPVHENDTRASVSDIKKIPIIPPFSDFFSEPDIILLGTTISKYPKNEIANKINTKKNVRFT